MSLQVFLDGKEIEVSGIHVEDDLGAGAGGSLTLDPSVAINLGDTISVAYNGHAIATGVVASTIHRSGSATSATFLSDYTFRPRFTQVDQAIIDEFLIDSFARGFARGG